MATRKKVILGIVIFLAVVLIALVVIVPLLFNVDRYRPQVAALIEQQTGKPTEIGRLALTVFPSLSIRVDGFALKNPSGFPEGYLVKTQRIYAVLDAGALWNHQVVIKSLRLDAPEISMLSDIKGTWNFANKPSSAHAAASDPPGEKPLFTLGIISDVTIAKGKVSMAGLLPSGKPGPVIFEADGFSSELQQVDINALTESASLQRTVVPRESAGASGGGWFMSVAYAAEPEGKPAANGTLKIDTLHLMNLAITNVKTNLRLFPKQVFLDGLDFDCYGGHAQGNLSFAMAGENPQYGANAQLRGVNVAKLLDAFPDARGKMAGTLDGTIKLEGEVSHSPDPLQGMRGSGQMSIRNGNLPSLQLSKNLLEIAQLTKVGPATGDPGAFSSMSTDFTIANNRIHNTKAAIIGNGVDVDADGSLALAGEGSLDYQGVAKVTANQNALTSIVAGISGATYADGKMAFPFTLGGTLQNPKFALKPGGASSKLGTIAGALSGQKGATGQKTQPADVLKGISGLFKKK